MTIQAREAKLTAIKKKSLNGFFLLAGRNAFSQIVVFLGFFFLSIFLDPLEMGVYIIVSELVGILGYFSDIGLAAALIQKKTKPSLSAIRSTFTFQQLMVVTGIVLFLCFAPRVSTRVAAFGPAESALLFAFVFSFFTASLKTIPSVLLERELKFKIITLVDLLENCLFYAVAVTLAFRGFGVYSYFWAVLVRSVVGVTLLYSLSPWPIGFDFNRSEIKTLFRFGIPFQLNSLLAVVKDRFSTILVWGIVGNYGISIVGWALRWSQAPLRFLMDVVMKITFPGFSRIQSNPTLLTKAIEKSVFFIALFVFPSLVGLNLLAPELVGHIPSYEKWRPALFSLALLSINSAFGAVTTPLTNALNAVGKIRITFRIMLMWTILTILLFPLFSHLGGYNGLALAHSMVATSSVVLWYHAKKYFQVSIPKTIWWPLFSSFVMGGFIVLGNRLFLLSDFTKFFGKGLMYNPAFSDYLSIGFYYFTKIGSAALLYLLCIYVFCKQDLLWFIQQLKVYRQKAII